MIISGPTHTSSELVADTVVGKPELVCSFFLAENACPPASNARRRGGNRPGDDFPLLRRGTPPATTATTQNVENGGAPFRNSTPISVRSPRRGDGTTYRRRTNRHTSSVHMQGHGEQQRPEHLRNHDQEEVQNCAQAPSEELDAPYRGVCSLLRGRVLAQLIYVQGGPWWSSSSGGGGGRGPQAEKSPLLGGRGIEEGGKLIHYQRAAPLHVRTIMLFWGFKNHLTICISWNSSSQTCLGAPPLTPLRSRSPSVP